MIVKLDYENNTKKANPSNSLTKTRQFRHTYLNVQHGTELFWNIKIFDGWVDDLRFYVFFNSISVISGRWAGDIERLWAMESRLCREDFASSPSRTLDR